MKLFFTIPRSLPFLQLTILLSFLTFTTGTSYAQMATTDFVTTWKTDNPGTSNSTSITIPTTGGSYDYDVDWDNDGSWDDLNVTGSITHDYGTAGTYTVRIRGAFPRIFFNNLGDRRKILSIDQWGNIAWTSMNSAFRGCSNLTYNATDAPDLSSVQDMRWMFSFTSSLTGGDLSNWDMSGVKNTQGMFLNATSFNGNVSGWDLSSVTDMAEMFWLAGSFNGDVSSWDVSGATDMAGMFNGASSFNGDVSSWDVSKVTDMNSMFTYATSFTGGDLSSWNVSKVINMGQMFFGAGSFNSDLSSWDVSKLIFMGAMFKGASSFTSDLSSWNVSSVINMSGVFFDASSFNSDVSNWDVTGVTNMNEMFFNASSFNSDLSSWDVSDVTTMTNMLNNCGMDITNYDNTLIGWAAQNVKQNVNLGATGLKYCLGETARNTLTSAPNTWNITGDAQAASDANAGPDQTVCALNVTLAANDPAFGTGMWSEVAGDNNGMFTNAGVHNTTFTGTLGVAYTLRWTITGGTCVKTDEVDITVGDNTPPNLICQNITVSLDSDGNLTITPAQVFNAALSSDNCGTVNLVSVSPNQFTCLNEGANNVTLTANDGNGNETTCPAVVTINEFITNVVTTATDETCAGAGDGTITLSASALGGQVKYSIDGGINFQSVGNFTNLSPGTYTIVVKVFGVPAVCEKTATATVAVGESPTTWSKDTDGDGYTDGTTVTSCAQPTGYINNPLPGTDCNDYDPLAFPGQTWYEDLDGDGYGSGNSQTACLRPAGCFTASELIAIDTDCDDSEATVNPAATEICDGLDNNCNGETDEGLSGTYVGNVFFSTQAQLDAWLACYDVIQGSVTIQGGNITNLAPLSNIVEITGNLMVLMNSVLTSLDGLENLADVGGALYMYYNFQLSDCCAVSGLLDNGGVSGPIMIFFNQMGCNSQTEIIAACNPASLVGGGSNNGFAQACSDCIPQGVLTVFPNPTSAIVNVKWTGENPSGTVQLTDLLGRVLMEQEMQSRNEFNVSKLGSGIYLVRVKVDGHKQQVERVVVER